MIIHNVKFGLQVAALGDFMAIGRCVVTAVRNALHTSAILAAILNSRGVT